MLALLLAADDDSTAYRIGYVLGMVVPVVLVVGLAVWGILAFGRSGKRKAASQAGLPPAGPVPAVAPAWYPDPSGSGLLRWWDGTMWTDQTAAPTGPATAPQGPPPPGPVPPPG